MDDIELPPLPRMTHYGGTAVVLSAAELRARDAEVARAALASAPATPAIPSAQPAPEPAALLPCPFCGNAKNLAMANERHDHSGGYFIACPACDASTGLRYATGEDPRPLLVEQWNRRAVRGHMGSTPDGGIDDHDEPRAWIPPAQVQAAVERWPKSLTYAVDLWFAQNTGLGGCSDKDVAELAAIFYGVTHEGGRESVDDALAVVDSFGSGIDGLNDTYARQVLLAQEVRRLHSDYIKAIKGRQEMRQALRIARDHLDMGALRTSHCKDAAAIESALGAPSAPVGDGAARAAADEWYLQDTRQHVGNDVLWWGMPGGYTTDVRKAQVFTRDAAYRQAKVRDTDRPWPKAYIDGKTRPAVDFQYLDHAEALATAQAGDGNHG